MTTSKPSKLTIILICLLLISFYTNYQYYLRKQQEKIQHKVYLNHLYFGFDELLTTLDTLLEEELPEAQLNKELLRLSQCLTKVEYLLTESPIYIEGVQNHGITTFQLVHQTIIYGSVYNGTQIRAFGEDSELNRCERAYLIELRDTVKDIHAKLYSEETGQENPNISKHVLNNIISDNLEYLFIDKYLEQCKSSS